MLTYYRPKTRYELVNWLLFYYPQDRAKFRRWNRARLYAVYYSVLKDKRKEVKG